MSAWVEATMRAPTETDVWPPRRSTRLSSTIRSSLPCPSRGSSVTASRYTVPAAASSKRPARAVTASVNAPRSWPNSSESISEDDRLAQSIVTNGCFARGPCSCSSRAMAFLPGPVSPAMGTVASVWANRRTCSTRSRIARLCAMKRSFMMVWAGRRRGLSPRRPRALVNVDALGIAPQPLEVVEQTRVGRKDVHDEIEVVEQNPFRSVAFEVRLGPALNGERVDHRIGNRANLARVAARANQAIIGEPRGVPQIQHDEIDGLLVLGGADGRIELLR